MELKWPWSRHWGCASMQMAPVWPDVAAVCVCAHWKHLVFSWKVPASGTRMGRFNEWCFHVVVIPFRTSIITPCLSVSRCFGSVARELQAVWQATLRSNLWEVDRGASSDLLPAGTLTAISNCWIMNNLYSDLNKNVIFKALLEVKQCLVIKYEFFAASS